MDFLEVLQKRRACHHFLANHEISDQQIKTLVEHTSLTPSGYNAQPWEFIVIRDPQRKKDLQKIAFNQSHVSDASAIVVMTSDLQVVREPEQLLQDWIDYGYCSTKEKNKHLNSFSKYRPYEKRFSMALRNGALAAMTFMYAAQNMNLATCPMMGFAQKKLHDYLQIPNDHIVIMMIALGYADYSKERPRLPRKKPQDLIHWEVW